MKPPPCPLTHKQSYTSREFAESILHRIWRRPGRGPGVMPTRAYRCQCRFWHLTHLTVEQQEERAAAKEETP